MMAAVLLLPAVLAWPGATHGRAHGHGHGLLGATHARMHAHGPRAAHPGAASRVVASASRDRLVQIRSATAADAGIIRDFVLELARYVGMEDQAKLSRDDFATDLSAGLYWCAIASLDEAPVGFALCYYTYSTWEGKGLYLEDLFVRPDARRQGVGMSLMTAVAQRALDSGCARLQWQTLDTNQNAIAFYTGPRIGASERVEDNDVRWCNLIMRSPEMKAFVQREVRGAHE